MKVALIGDTHHGARGDSQIMLNYQKKFFAEVFFPTVVQQKITHIIHLGDIVDRRTSINFNTVKHLREDFLDQINQNGITMDVICGNHDTFYKSTNQLNAFDSIFGDYRDKITTYTEATETNFGLYVPWINPENNVRSIDMIKQSKSKFVFGHLEIDGFEMLRGILCDHGVKSSIFRNFEYVFSGHFHHKSSKDPIHYLGAPYQMTWNDFGSERGFHIFDTETQQLQFIENPNQLFIRLIYRGVDDIDADVHGAYCKVVVKEKGDPYVFDKFIQRLENQQPADLKIVHPLTQETNDVIISQAENTETIISKHIDILDCPDQYKRELHKLINELYSEAIDIERSA